MFDIKEQYFRSFINLFDKYMAVGPVPGKPVSKPTISSVAEPTQDLELQTTVAKAQTIARVSNASNMEKSNPTHNAKGGLTMPVGSVPGKPVSTPLINSVAATTQAQETTAADQMSEKQSETPPDTLLEQFKSGEADSKAVQKEIRRLSNLVNLAEEEKGTDQKQLERIARKMEAAVGKEPLSKSRSRERKRKNREEGSGDRTRSSSDKRKRDDKHRPSEKSREEEERKSREGQPPHKGTQPWKSRTDSENNVSRKNGSLKQ